MPDQSPPHIFSRDELAENFRAFGVKAGDVLYLRAALRAIGATPENQKDILLDAALDAVGPQGAVLAPAFTRQYPVWWRDMPFAEDDRTPSTGAISKMIMARPGSVRSGHPTHSFVAVGGRAAELMAGHDRHCACFEPLRKVARAGGKMMLVGCINSSPGFSTLHLAQHDLGLSQQHYVRFLFHIKVRDERGQPLVTILPEAPGCSRGFGKLYPRYEADGNFRTGLIGEARTVLADVDRAYRTDIEALTEDPKSVLCDVETCIRCRILCGYNLSDAPAAFVKNVVRRGPSIAMHMLKGGSLSDLIGIKRQPEA